jgi:dephospho-CoA kinase
MTPKVVGLTGGMASGKSYVRSVFEDLDVPCIDCDVVARDIHQNPQHIAMGEISVAFPSAMTPDGRLATAIMRDILGSDPTANARLQAILTPHLREHLTAWTAAQAAPYVIWESAIMIESGAKVDRMLVVDVDPEVQLKRIKARNPNWSDEQIITMLGLQLDRGTRLGKADDVIFNNKTPHFAFSQVMALHHKYQELWAVHA